MDYTKYTVEDLATDDSFIQWANRSNRKAEAFWDAFIAAHPEMSHKVAQARTLVLNLRKAETVRHPEQQIDALWLGIEDRISREMRMQPTDTTRKRSLLPMAIAAVMLLLFSSVSWFLYTSVHNPQGAPTGPISFNAAYIEEVNTTGSVLRVHLSDGSSVALENNSRLKYRKDFLKGPSREVYLTGEAFFDVAKDPTQPFLVHTNEVVTRVLGTSFRVKASDDDEVVVSVKTGKVSVYTVNPENQDTPKSNAVILLPNQQVTYLRKQESFGKALVPVPDVLSPSVEEADFVFENTPIKNVFKALEKAYGIEIIFDEEIMSNCFITAPLGSEPLFEKLRIICRTIGARYETIDAKVVITSTGC